MVNKQTMPEDNFPAGLSNPARRALTNAGYTRLEQLNGVSEAEIKKLHGIGPNALQLLRGALAEKGLAFGPAPAKKNQA